MPEAHEFGVALNWIGRAVTDPNWWQVLLTAAAGGLAWRAFTHEREAVRRTQRADLLLSGLTVEPEGPLAPTSHLVARFKNYGPTRASEVRVRGSFLHPSVTDDSAKGRSPAPTRVVAASGEIPLHLPPFGGFFEPAVVEAIAEGRNTMSLKLTVTYDDVFGATHESTRIVEYDPRSPTGLRVIEESAT
jgi:hypothetical protein